MNVFAKFDEIPSIILKVIKETKRYGHTDGRSVGPSDNGKQCTLPQTLFAGGLMRGLLGGSCYLLFHSNSIGP